VTSGDLRALGSSTWTSLKYVYPDSAGKDTYTYTSSATRDYRMVFGDTSVVWGHTSAVVRK